MITGLYRLTLLGVEAVERARSGLGKFMNIFMMIVIMRITSIDRSRELNFLEERYRSHKAEIVVCGRRRWVRLSS